MREWYTAAELAAKALPDLPATKQGVLNIAERSGWRDRRNLAAAPLARRRQGRGGGWEYHYTLLPMRAQQKLVAEDLAAKAAIAPAAPEKGAGELWAWFERLPDKRKAVARARADALDAVAALTRGGIQKHIGVHEIARQRGVAASTIYVWFDLVSGADRGDWLPRLAPRHAGRTKTVECDPEAWEVLKGDWLRNSKPSFMSCYDRLKLAAERNGWTIPSARTLERRLRRDVSATTIKYLRDGQEDAAKSYPWQERDRTMFHALEAVNVDGHTWDVNVIWPDGIEARPVMVPVQDLYSDKVLAWRVDRSENVDAVRLAFADVFREFGIPEHCWMDNGRAFASKKITGGAPNRYRFKVKPEDPTGVLVSLGVQVHWTTPYHGQAKPIERSFRDFCDRIAKHPAFEGAYTGNNPVNKPANYGSRAVSLDDFLKVVAEGIRQWNAKPGRNTRVCAGVKSFDQAFEESYRSALIRKCPPEKLRMCLLAAESVRADRDSGSVRVMRNRYWAGFMAQLAGHPLTIRFDPERLHDGVHVYRLDGGYIGFAECLDTAGFADTEKARDHARKKKAHLRAVKEVAAFERAMTPKQIAAIYADCDVDEPAPPETKLVRMVAGNLAAKAAAEPDPEAMTAEQVDRALNVGLSLIQGGRGNI